LEEFYNEFMGHALAPVEQQQMEYTELNYFFGNVKQLPPVWKNQIIHRTHNTRN
jgi:hypothetical protein